MGGTGTPAARYSCSLLRKVRMEIPSISAARVRLPKQWERVSRINSRSTSSIRRPTSAAAFRGAGDVAAACAGTIGAGEASGMAAVIGAAMAATLVGVINSMASAPIALPSAKRTAR